MLWCHSFTSLNTYVFNLICSHSSDVLHSFQWRATLIPVTYYTHSHSIPENSLHSTHHPPRWRSKLIPVTFNTFHEYLHTFQWRHKRLYHVTYYAFLDRQLWRHDTELWRHESESNVIILYAYNADSYSTSLEPKETCWRVPSWPRHHDVIISLYRVQCLLLFYIIIITFQSVLFILWRLCRGRLNIIERELLKCIREYQVNLTRII